MFMATSHTCANLIPFCPSDPLGNEVLSNEDVCLSLYRSWEYYVHYVHCNRRLDEWVPAERFDFSKLTDGAPSVTQVGDLSEIAKKSTRKTVKKGLKRKASESKGASGNPYSKSKKDERTAEEKEHEEATKVKNIQKIQIGKWEMDTWYYSPFPPEYAGQLPHHHKERKIVKGRGRCRRFPLIFSPKRLQDLNLGSLHPWK